MEMCLLEEERHGAASALVVSMKVRQTDSQLTPRHMNKPSQDQQSHLAKTQLTPDV